METIILGGGCFWCIEAIYKRLEGVISVKSGYTCGKLQFPTYEEVCSGNSGHIEVVFIEFDNEEIELEEILDIFWQVHDPTTLNQQGNDIGTQYRSVIFYIEEYQKSIIENSLHKLNNSAQYNYPIVTEIRLLDIFYPAEDYHQDYYKNNSNQPYSSIVIHPKIKKFETMIKKK